jgi:hypothetical protein
MSESPRTRVELIEALADVEHQRWADWQQWVHATCGPDPTHSGLGALLILPENVKRWNRQIHAPYAALTESEKQSDREQVARYWPLIVEFVAAWLEEVPLEPDDEAHTLAESWREEMAQ